MRNACFAAITVSIAMLLSPLALAPVPALAQTQTVVIDCLPPRETNNRFRKPARIRHPGLSLNGFDCGDNCDIGYGFKQVLEKVYGSESEKEKEVQTVFNAIVEQAKQVFQDTSKFGHIRDNTGRLQARGFIALASYILENNDYDPTMLSPALPTAAVAVENFKTALVERKWKLNSDQQDDGVKWATPIMNIARAIDFYLALENAYKHYDIIEYDNTVSTHILSIVDKRSLMAQYRNLIQDFEGLADTDIPKSISELASSRYNLEPGNASLKAQLSIGYAALTWQAHNINNLDDINGKIGKYIVRSFSSILSTSNTDRNKYWGYQSDNGKPFWSEGPYYFHLTLSQVIPFLHSARINNKLETYGYIGDPFRDNRFLNPLHWLADVSTPDGKTPPIDDGNKINMYNTSLLPWKSDYGNEEIGKKFAWIIGDKQYSRSPLYPVEIAIPRISKPNQNQLAEAIGNTFQNRSTGENGRQEVVVRRSIDRRQHYILLNGESGDAIDRGEGHEQGDQMQLLYYVDDISYLVDSGYDSPLSIPLINASWFPPKIDVKIWTHSTWNPYTNHNVMTMEPKKNGWYNNNGGIRSPWLNFIKKARVQSYHQSINEIYHQEFENIDLISANIDLKAADKDGLNANVKTFAYYYRNILFIRDPKNPYLIDINSISGDKQKTQNWYKMYYHVNSDDASIIKYPNTFRSVAMQWNNIYLSDDLVSPVTTNKGLYIQPFTIERPLYLEEESDLIRESYISDIDRGIGIDIKKMMLRGNASSGGKPKENFTTIALIRPLFNKETNLPLAKDNLPLLPVNTDRTWQYITWQHDANTIDVIVSRSGKYYANASSSPGFSRSSLDFPITEAGSFYILLPYNKNYGFARLRKNNSIWSIDPNFQVNLKISNPRVNISGPACILEGDKGRYTSSKPVGGKSPYSYSWSYYRTCPDAISGASNSSLGPTCNDWNGIETIKNIDFGGHNREDFQIRLKVTDSSSPQRSSFSATLDVQIRSSAEGGCPSNPDTVPEPAGKMDTQTQQIFASEMGFLETDKSVPEAYALRQNFPNPFNPSTEILFDLPETAMVSLVVYDVLGREVAHLVESELPAGWHRARFDAGNLPSGIYLYRIQAGDFQDTGRMLLLK